MTPLAALQATLAGEHAAVYVFGVLGGRISTSAAPTTAAAISSAYAMHRARRDQLVPMILARGAEPVASEVAYQLTGPAMTTRQIVREARVTESRCAEIYAQTVAGTTGDERGWAVDALTDAAVRLLGFGGAPEAFPGLPEI
jgi:hypothetical protein